MKKLRKAVQDYVALRRALGFKLEKVEKGLLDFVSFLERQGSSHLTTARALQWATQPSHVQPFMWAQRLSYVRGFARHWSATGMCCKDWRRDKQRLGRRNIAGELRE